MTYKYEESTWKFYTLSSSPTIDKINSFINLSEGWHYGEGNPPKPSTIEDSTRFLRIAQSHGFNTSDAFPGIEGEVLVSFYDDNNSLDFTFENSGYINYAKEQDGNITDEKDNITLNEAIQIIRNLRVSEWKSSDYSVSDITTRERDDSRASVSRTQENQEATSTAFQLLVESAYMTGAREYANM